MKIREMLEEVDAQTIVVFDLDYTLFRSTTNLGMPEWIHYFVNKEMKSGISRREALQRWYPIWLKAQEIVDVVLMDQEIPNILEYLKNHCVGVLGLTARGAESHEITNQQLNQLGLTLRSIISNLPVSFDFEDLVLLKNGILYTHEFNDKGDVFVEWFYKIQRQLPNDTIIKKIIFIDDSAKNIASMDQAVKKLNLIYQGYHYTLSNAFKEKFDPKIAEQEVKILMNYTSNLEAKKAIDAIKYDLISL